VGSWRKYGIDPHLFANTLCTETNRYLQEHLGCDSDVDIIIEDALKHALDLAQSQHMGTSTISVGVMVTEQITNKTSNQAHDPDMQKKIKSKHIIVDWQCG